MSDDAARQLPPIGTWDLCLARRYTGPDGAAWGMSVIAMDGQEGFFAIPRPEKIRRILNEAVTDKDSLAQSPSRTDTARHDLATAWENVESLHELEALAALLQAAEVICGHPLLGLVWDNV